MCGRFNVTSDPMTQLFMDLVGEPYRGTENHNAAPMSKAWIIRNASYQPPSSHSASELIASNAQWWLIPSWVKERSTKYSMFNARSETLRKSPAFRSSFKDRRCLVPITGFYEWVNRNGVKQPYYIRDLERKGLVLAGIWDRWWEDQENYIDSFAIVTTAVVEDLKFLHHRQPVMMNREQALEWLDPTTQTNTLEELCSPRVPTTLSVMPVSDYVNNTRNKGSQCLEVIGDEILIDSS